MPLNNKQRTIHIALIFLVGILIYANSLNGEFQFDDKPYIVENINIHDISDPARILNFQKTRFLGQLSFALNYHFHGLNVFGYHIVNVLIHILNAILVYWLVHLLVDQLSGGQKRAKDHRQWLAVFVSLLFLTHPIQTQAVAYITQRFASLVSLFYLLSFCSYLKARAVQEGKRQLRYYCLAGISALCAVLTKENSFTLVFVIMMYEIFLQRSSSGRRLKLALSSTHFIYLAVLVLICMSIPLAFSFDVNKIIFGELISRSHDGDVITPLTYLLTQFRVLATYLSLLMFPVGQNFDYDFALSKSFFEIPFLLNFLFIAFIIFIGFKMMKKRPLMAFGIFWFFVTGLVESSFKPIPHVIFEHRVYLPSVGIFLCVSSLLLEKLDKSKFIKTMSVVVIVLCFLTFQRNKLWQTEIALWADCVKKSPRKIRPYNNLAAALLEKRRYADALKVLELAQSNSAIDYKGYSNFGEIYLKLEKWAQARESFEKALTKRPDYAGALTGLGLVALKEGDVPEAERLFIQAVAKGRDHLRAAFNLAQIFENKGDLEAAIDLYEQIIQKFPKHSYVYYVNLGKLYQKRGQNDMAVRIWNRGKRQFPKAHQFDELILNVKNQ